MKIKLRRVSGIKESIEDMKRPAGKGTDSVFSGGFIEKWGETDLKRAKALCNQASNSGHPNFLSGIRVHLEITAPHYFWNQLQRYHWFDIVSSSSKMYTLTSITVRDHTTDFVLPENTVIIQQLINMFNSSKGKEDSVLIEYLEEWFSIRSIQKPERLPEDRREFFEFILDNVPLGYQLTAGVSTNYLQLRNAYEQRKNHRLSHWNKDFVNFCENLPHSWFITQKECPESEL